VSATCKICRSPKCQDVDIDLVNSVPYRTIAARYGFSLNGVKRHFKPDDGSASHVKKPILAAKEAEVIKHGKTLEERIDEIYNTSFGLIKLAVSQGDPRAGASCLAQSVAVTSLLTRIEGKDTTNLNVNIKTVADLVKDVSERRDSKGTSE
jgi:hypothetical protein